MTPDSIVEHYDIIKHEKAMVKKWSKLFIDSIDRQINYETKREAEEKMLRGLD